MAALNGLFNKKKLALTRAKLAAWWEGTAYDEEAALAAYEAKLAAVANENAEAEASDVEDELFDELPFEMPPRLSALALIWGEGRVRPGDATAEAMEPARIGVAADGMLAVWGPGLAAPVIAIASKHPGKIEVYEWREETIEALRHEVKQAKLDDRVTVTRIDLEAHVYPAASLDGIYSVDDFAYVGYPPHLAQQVMKSLKPGACAVLEAYVGFKSDTLKTAFASSFAEPQIRAHGDVLQFFRDVGLQIEADEDLTDEFLATARGAFKQLGERLAQSGGIEPAAARELAWETEAWRVRLMMLAQRRLERRRFVVRKPQAENTNEPAG
jgi:hypothetical protein